MPLQPISTWHIALGQQLRAIRRQRRLKLKDVAATLGCTWQIYQRYEKATARVYADVLAQLALSYDVPVETFYPKALKAHPIKKPWARG